MKLFTHILALFLLPLSLLAQPLITNETIEKMYFDDFTDDSQNWPTLSEANIKAMVLQGYYYMERPGSTKSRAVMPTLPAVSNKFMIKTSLQLGPANSEAQTLGILFMTQSDGSGGFVFEINRKQQFRIRGIVSSGQYITTGEAGWLKSKNILANEFNKIVIKGFAGKYDIYINDVFNFSFQNASFKSGEFGLLIGPEAKGKVDYFYVYKLMASMPDVDEKEAMAAAIDSLKKENDSLKLQLSTTHNTNIKDAEAAIKILEQQLEASHKENTQLKKKISQSNANAMKQLLYKVDSLKAENKRMQQIIDILDNTMESTPSDSINIVSPSNTTIGRKEEE